MRASIIIALAIAAVTIGVLTWHHYRKKPVVAAEDKVLVPDEPQLTFESILPAELEWQAVGFHLGGDEEHDDMGPFMGVGQGALLWQQEQEQQQRQRNNHHLSTTGLEVGAGCTCTSGNCVCPKGCKSADTRLGTIPSRT